MARMNRLGTTVALGVVLVAGGLLACKKKQVEETPVPVETAAAADPAVPAPSGGAVAGNWDIASSANPGGGGAYEGSVEITQNGGYYDLSWTLKKGQGYQGVGLVVGDILGVGWSPKSPGVVVYTIDGGTLNGTWSTAGSGGKVGTEKAEGPAGLNGSYRVTGTNPGGSGGYNGTLSITPAGSVYRLAWRVGNDSYQGLGIKRGDKLVVGWSTEGSAGVVLYSIKGSTLDGVWAQPGSTALGSERLTKQ